MKYILPIALCFLFTSCFSQDKKNWTIMHYSVGSNSSETHLMSDIEEMKQGKISNDYNLVALVDRIEGFSNDSVTLDGNFTDTRLYKIEHNSYQRLDGGEFFPEITVSSSYEANMANALTLKKFISYCKKHYPANHYMLVLRSHGNGYAMCPDNESGNADRIYPAEISDVLTKNESVDILGLDVCSMASLENLYEWRPSGNSFSADYVLASAPLSGAWAYDAILGRLTDQERPELTVDSNFFEGGAESNINPTDMTPLQFSNLLFEEIYDNQRWSSWGLFDNTKISQVKSAIDKASVLLTKENKELISEFIESTLGYYHNISNDLEVAQLTCPYIDAYHFWSQIGECKEFVDSTRVQSKLVCSYLDEFVVHSYHGNGYFPETSNFTNSKSGVYQIIPIGNKTYSQSKNSYWSHCNWFHPHDRSDHDNSYGKYDWCSDGAIERNQKVDNFYEFLDYLFDPENDSSGGVNGYTW